MAMVRRPGDEGVLRPGDDGGAWEKWAAAYPRVFAGMVASPEADKDDYMFQKACCSSQRNCPKPHDLRQVEPVHHH
nr:unnamed protein product [Digitaria exilis]